MNAASVVADLLAAAAAAVALPPRPAPLEGVRGPAPEVPDPPVASRVADGTYVRLGVALSVAAGVLVLVGHLVGAAAGVALGLLSWRLTSRMESPAARRRRERLSADLPHLVDLLSACLTAGLAPSAALEQVAAAMDGPAADELHAVTSRLRLGVAPAAAWRELGRHPQLGPLGRCVARSVESGASVADAMTRLAEDLRGDVRAEVEARARSVGVKAAVPLGICMLPAFVLVGVVPLVVGSVPLVLGR